MPSRDLDDDLWLGILAAQTGLVAPEAVLAAARAERPAEESLDETLVRLGVLTREDQSLLQTLRERLVARNVPCPSVGWSSELKAILVESQEAAVASADGKTPAGSFDTLPLPSLPVEQSFDIVARMVNTRPTMQQAAPVSHDTSRFRIVRLHARGGLGQVSLAIDEELQREVALKEIQFPYADDPDARARFEREARITGSLEHPGIVPVYGLGVSSDGRPYYAMRFIQGRSMKEALGEYHRERAAGKTESTMQFRELLRRFIEMCNAVEYAHSRGIIHRDLKPDNVMLGPYGETLVVDWGLARQSGRAEDLTPASLPAVQSGNSVVETQHGSALGTPQYMSPEQAKGDWEAVGTSSDVYSLGATLYHLLTGSTAFTAENLGALLRQVCLGQFPPPRAVLAETPPPLEAICLKAMALLPADRYASARELATEIERWLADEPVAAYRERFQERWFRRLRRHRTWTMALATVLPLLLAVVTAAAVWVDGARREAVRQKELSDQAKDAEAAQKRIAVAATADARRSLVNFLTANGERSQSEGDVGAAMLWFVKALPLVNPDDKQAVQSHRIRLALLLRQLPRMVQAWTLPADQRQRVARQVISPDSRQVLFTGRTVVGVDAASGQPLWPPLPYGQQDLIPWVGYSPDGSRIIALAQKRSIRIWDARTGQPMGPTLETAHDIPLVGTGAEGQAEMSADHRWLVVTTAAPTGLAVEVWDVVAGRRRFPPLEFAHAVTVATFSPDSRQLLVGTDSQIKVYNVDDGQPSGKGIEVPGLWQARYSPDGRWIATASGEGHAQIWDASTREAAGPPLTHRGPVTLVAFSPDAERLLTLSADNTARLWDVAAGKAAGLPLDHSDRPLTGSFSVDGRRVVTVTINHTVHVWDGATGRQLAAPMRHATEPTVSAAGDSVLVALEGRSATWDLSRSAQPSSMTVEGIERIQHLAFSPDSATLAAVSGNQAWLLNSHSGAVQAGPLSHGSNIHSIAISSNGQWLATAGDDGTARLWNVADGRPHPSKLKHAKSIAFVRFDPQGQRLLSCSEDNTARIWDAATGDPIGAPLVHQAAVRIGDFSPDGRWVITGSDDGSARVWNSADGRPRPGDESLIQIKPPQPIQQVGFNPNGETVLAASRSGTIYLWSPFQASTPLRTFPFEGAGINTAAFSPDGRYLLAAGMANVIRVWDWRQPERPSAALPVATAAFHAQFHPGSGMIAATSFGGVQLWEADGGRPIGTRLGPLAHALAFSPDGRWLVGYDDSLRWWDLTPAAHSPADLEKLVSLSATREIDERGTLQFLSAERIEALHRELLKPGDGNPRD